MRSFPVAMDDRWFPGPVSHPYPGVSSCRTDPAFQGNPRLPVVGLPDCWDVGAGDSLSPVTSLGPQTPGLSTGTFKQLGLPVPDNYSFPSHGALEDTLGVHMQAFRLGDILFTVCSCEQWVEQSYNIKTRTDRKPGNEYVGYDPTSPKADPSLKCTKNAGTTWSCTKADPMWSPETRKVSDALVQHMRAQILNDAKGWDDPRCKELGCGVQAESEPTDLGKIRGNFTHDDTRGNARRGYKLTVTIAMANDYNGYIASYREYMDHDHYRKALTGWGPHSSDYYATRLAQMGRALHGDAVSRREIDGQTVAAKSDPAWAPLVAKEAVDQKHADAKVRAVGEAAAQGVKAYELTLSNDGGSDQELVQPKDIQRFDSATFTWSGGNNYTDNPAVRVERQVDGNWVPFADQSGEIPVTLQYPESSPGPADPGAPAALANGLIGYRAGGQTWRWTASFEAFVSQFPLIDAQGNSYSATPPGTYRFIVEGSWRKGNADMPYTRVSREFEVKPWTGLTVDGAGLDAARHVRFTAGPTHAISEYRVRRTAREPLARRPDGAEAPVTFNIGPVDFPDTARDQKATGARFLTNVRGYSGTSTSEVEHYCLDCSFRPWLDATNAVTGRVTIVHADGTSSTELVKPDPAGSFTTAVALAPGESATIVLDDAWGDTTAAPVTVAG
jgi:hypothetical protein